MNPEVLKTALDMLTTKRDQLAQARIAASAAKATVNIALEDFNAQHVGILSDLQAAESLRDALDQDLRNMIVDYYKNTSDKHPIDGLGVRVTKKVVYDLKQAFNWAKGTGLALKLDNSAFEKIVLATSDTGGNGIPAKIEEVPGATIATDLNVFLGESR